MTVPSYSLLVHCNKMQYLASNNKRERLVLSIEDEFLLGEAKLKAQYFDNNYVIDANEIISCKVIHQETKENIELDFLYKNNGYELDLKHLKAGVYSYVIKTKKNKLTKKGVFEILDFNISRINMPHIDFEVECSKGTYIRALANDFGEKLNSGATLYKLNRTKIGEYSVNKSISIEEFTNNIS